MDWEFLILGPLAVRRTPEDSPLELGEKLRLLLGRMLIEPAATLSTSQLAADVWGTDKALKSPVNTIHAAMKQVRERLADRDKTLIVSVDQGYRLHVSDPLRIDAERFRQLTRRGRELRETNPRAARVMLDEALGCWRGPLLGEHGVCAWAAGHAAEFESLRSTAQADLNELRLELGEFHEVESALRRQIVERPADERLRAQLVRALDGAGRSAEAALAYRDSVRELGAPGPELRRLGDQIGRGVPANAPRSRAPSFSRSEDVVLHMSLQPIAGGPGLGTLALLVDRFGGVPHPLATDSGPQLLACFEHVEAAVKAAQALAADDRLRPAIAIHAGPTMHLGDRLIGTGPARARLVGSAARPGQVFVTEEARQRLREPTPLRALRDQRLEDPLSDAPLYVLTETDSSPTMLRSHPHNLPVQATSFVGRARELAELSRLLSPGQLVTLVGQGGCGKTRSALQLAASHLSGFPDGAWFASLAEVDRGATSETVAGGINAQLGIRSLPDEPASRALVRHLSDRAALVVVDNCEHVLEAVADLIPRLQRGCPHLCLIATSRQPLRVPAERVVEVPALSTEADDPESLPDAVELLLERSPGSLGASSGEEAIRDALRICQALEGSPLAIELAAAHVSRLGLASVAVQIETMMGATLGSDFARPPRQRTLAAAVGWSHALLSDQQRQILRRLAVFRGSFGLSEASLVTAGQDLPADRAADVIRELIECSMVTPEPSSTDQLRLRLSQPIRSFALAELDAAEHARLCQRHADVFLRLASELSPGLFGPDEAHALERLEADHDNLRAALTWLVGERDGAGALALVDTLWWLWFAHGHLSEGGRWLQTALALDERPSMQRVRALRDASHLAWWRGDYAEALEYARELEACAHNAGDDWGVAWVSLLAGAVLMFSQQERALDRLADGHRRFRELGHHWDEAYALHLIAAAHWFSGDERAASAAYEDASNRFAALGHGSMLAAARRGAGLMAARCGQVDRGAVLVREALRFSESIGDRAGSAQALNFLAAMSREAGDLSTAGARFSNALVYAREAGDLWGTCVALDGVASVASDVGESELAARLLAQSRRLGDRSGFRPAAHDRRQRSADTDKLLTELGRRDFERATAEGELMGVSNAVALAIAFTARFA